VRCFVVAGFLLTSASRGPSAIAEPLVLLRPLVIDLPLWLSGLIRWAPVQWAWLASSYKCDRPSHPDWGCLGVVRAASVDNRWQGPVVLGPHFGTLPEKPAG